MKRFAVLALATLALGCRSAPPASTDRIYDPPEKHYEACRPRDFDGRMLEVFIAFQRTGQGDVLTLRDNTAVQRYTTDPSRNTLARFARYACDPMQPLDQCTVSTRYVRGVYPEDDHLLDEMTVTYQDLTALICTYQRELSKQILPGTHIAAHQ